MIYKPGIMSAKRKYLAGISAAIVVVAFAAVMVVSGGGSEKMHTVALGNFELAIEVKGEIQGKNAIIIGLPDDLKRNDLRIYQLKLKDLVEEGTLVRQGDYIATLDAAQITQQMQNNNQDLDKRRAELNDARIDSSIQLTSLREELAEFTYDLAYKKLELEQARFESPAYQRKIKVEYDKTIREMEKKHRDYELKRLDLKMKTKRIEDRFLEHHKRDSLLKRAMVATRVTSPKEGMVMYVKMWNGRKLRVGDEVNMWMPDIATLPDMSQPVSEAYIQEIDITKIAVGDSVDVTVDALPGKTIKGAVSDIANIGQELQGFDMKVFKILIDLKAQGNELKPAMTSSNRIILKKMPNVVKIPRNCLFRINGESFVYIKEGGQVMKKLVTPGIENETEVVIESGLAPGDRILLSSPENAGEIVLWAGK
jgi:multidrug efflux pump subunit AcrA (membrane-fusion protein)